MYLIQVRWYHTKNKLQQENIGKFLDMNMYCYDNSKNTTEIEMSADIEYRNDGMFIGFYPVTSDGQKSMGTNDRTEQFRCSARN